MKKALLLTLTLICVALVVLLCSCGPKKQVTENGVIYTLSDDGTYYTVSDGRGASGALEIPAAIKEIPVKNIGMGAFIGSAVESVVIPDSVESYSLRAFMECTDLKSITLSASADTINEAMFASCYKLTEIVIPSSVTLIDDQAFLNCISLSSITISEGLERIGDGAFKGCSSLASISIPKSLLFLGDNCFSDCSSLKSVYITDMEAWYDIEYRSDSTVNFMSYSTPLRNGADLYLNGEKVVDLVIPNGTVLREYLFAGCTSLVSVTLPEDLTLVSALCFYGCSSLETVVLPSTLKELDDSAFAYCTSLKSITIPASVTIIDDRAFVGCSSITSIYFADASNWYYENGAKVSVTSPSENAEQFKNGAYRSYIKR